MARSTFAERFGYARWLKHLISGEAPTFAEIGRGVERTGQAVSGWATSEEPPKDYRVHAPLAELLGVGKDWLIDESGDPSRPELWKLWLTERRRAPRMPAKAFAPAGKKSAAKRQA